MQISTLINYAGGFKDAVDEIKQLESAGLDMVWVPEAYSFDAPSAMGYLAANTERVKIASGILPIYSRTPTLIAQRASPTYGQTFSDPSPTKPWNRPRETIKNY